VYGLLREARRILQGIASARELNKRIDKALEEAAYVYMSVEAYRQRREVRWDATRKEII